MRNSLYIILTAIGLLLQAACAKKEAETPSFEVSLPKSTYQVGESVEFNFSGKANMITFYSGEQGKKYENINRITAAGTPKLQFTSVRANGSQAGSLLLMVSADFKGVGSDEATTVGNINQASWTDITSRAKLSAGTSTASGAVDLSDFAAANKPVYVAFKYLAAPGSIQNKWTISGLTVTNVLNDASVYTLANLSSAVISNYGAATIFSPGWVAYKVSNNFNWIVTAGSSLVITGATTAALATAPAEAWVFCGPIALSKISPDLGTTVQNISTREVRYAYKYPVAGTYTATFVGGDQNIYGSKEIIKQLTLTITP